MRCFANRQTQKYHHLSSSSSSDDKYQNKKICPTLKVSIYHMFSKKQLLQNSTLKIKTNKDNYFQIF